MEINDCRLGGNLSASEGPDSVTRGLAAAFGRIADYILGGNLSAPEGPDSIASGLATAADRRTANYRLGGICS